MESKRPLKVFRTSAGFEDAYIAARSRKAALAAWGAKRDLFAQGAAEVVTDPELAKAALERPGEVLRVPRGTTAQHLAATGTSMTNHGPRDVKAKVEVERPAKPEPRPSRDRLDAARSRLEKARSDGDVEENRLAQEIERLKANLARVKKRNKNEIVRLQTQVEEQEALYRKALAAWKA